MTEDGVYHQAGIRQGLFRVEVSLPVLIEWDRVEASYDRGLLRVRLPKAAGGGRNG